MTILVVGAGATGGFYGLRLVQADRDVTFLVRERRADVLRQRGLRVVGQAGEEWIDPQLVTADAIERTYDTVILSVKAMALRAAMDDLTPAIGSDTRIVPFLNGIAHLEALNNRFGTERVLGGVVKVPTQLNDDGDVVWLSTDATMEIGAQDGSASLQLDRVAAELSGAGFEFSLSENIIAAMWEKWAVHRGRRCACWSTVLMRGTIGDVVGCPGGSELGPAILEEAAAVAAAAGYPLTPPRLPPRPTSSPQSARRWIHPYTEISVAGVATEVEEILGDLVARGQSMGVATPLLELATLSLRVYEARRAPVHRR